MPKNLSNPSSKKQSFLGSIATSVLHGFMRYLAFYGSVVRAEAPAMNSNNGEKTSLTPPIDELITLFRGANIDFVPGHLVAKLMHEGESFNGDMTLQLEQCFSKDCVMNTIDLLHLYREPLLTYIDEQNIKATISLREELNGDSLSRPLVEVFNLINMHSTNANSIDILNGFSDLLNSLSLDLPDDISTISYKHFRKKISHAIQFLNTGYYFLNLIIEDCALKIKTGIEVDMDLRVIAGYIQVMLEGKVDILSTVSVENINLVLKKPVYSILVGNQNFINAVLYSLERSPNSAVYWNVSARRSTVKKTITDSGFMWMKSLHENNICFDSAVVDISGNDSIELKIVTQAYLNFILDADFPAFARESCQALKDKNQANISTEMQKALSAASAKEDAQELLTGWLRLYRMGTRTSEYFFDDTKKKWWKNADSNAQLNNFYFFLVFIAAFFLKRNLHENFDYYNYMLKKALIDLFLDDDDFKKLNIPSGLTVSKNEAEDLPLQGAGNLTSKNNQPSKKQKKVPQKKNKKRVFKTPSNTDDGSGSAGIRGHENLSDSESEYNSDDDSDDDSNSQSVSIDKIEPVPQKIILTPRHLEKESHYTKETERLNDKINALRAPFKKFLAENTFKYDDAYFDGKRAEKEAVEKTERKQAQEAAKKIAEEQKKSTEENARKMAGEAKILAAQNAKLAIEEGLTKITAIFADVISFGEQFISLKGDERDLCRSALFVAIINLDAQIKSFSEADPIRPAIVEKFIHANGLGILRNAIVHHASDVSDDDLNYFVREVQSAKLANLFPMANKEGALIKFNVKQGTWVYNNSYPLKSINPHRLDAYKQYSNQQSFNNDAVWEQKDFQALLGLIQEIKKLNSTTLNPQVVKKALDKLYIDLGALVKSAPPKTREENSYLLLNILRTFPKLRNKIAHGEQVSAQQKDNAGALLELIEDGLTQAMGNFSSKKSLFVPAGAQIVFMSSNTSINSNNKNSSVKPSGASSSSSSNNNINYRRFG
jgi:hypothetical protein